jgi:hypothetical protein
MRNISCTLATDWFTKCFLFLRLLSKNSIEHDKVFCLNITSYFYVHNSLLKHPILLSIDMLL